MSGDAEQEYFSDGISEDIITDLSKVSFVAVVSRNTAFGFKGGASTSRRSAGSSRSLTSWKERAQGGGPRTYRTARSPIKCPTTITSGPSADDREIPQRHYPALQDEISQAIVKALKLKLLPEEKKAIEQRGTTNLEAYNLYLMARQFSVTGNYGNVRRCAAIIGCAVAPRKSTPTMRRPGP